MDKYLFRAEAVNLSPTVYDTCDISTIRGGGFYLLDRVHQLAVNSKFKDFLITEGASTAVFKIETDHPDSCREEILQFLYGTIQQSKPIREMMFLVEYVELGDDFKSAMAKLMGKIRLSQMRSPSIRIFNNTLKPKQSMRFDELNRVLPAHEKDSLKGYISSFTKDRLGQGRTLRKKIYSELLKHEPNLIKDIGFTDSLEELSVDPNQGNLSGKIAYIYIDGNKFGALQKNFSEEDFREYDQKLQGFKKIFLAEILRLTSRFKSFLKGNNRIRLETLLWGGDELKLVVPAWLGWEVASLFFGLTCDTNLNLKINGKDLTYAMGLVFAHHNNPIKNITKVAEELVSAVKGDIANAYNRALGDRMHCIVLESLETLPASYKAFCCDYYKTDPEKLCFSPGDLHNMRSFAKFLDMGFPRTRVFKIAAAWAEGKDRLYAELINDGLDAYEGGISEKKELVKYIKNVTQTQFDNGKAQETRASAGYRWLQMAELLDYLV